MFSLKKIKWGKGVWFQAILSTNKSNIDRNLDIFFMQLEKVSEKSTMLIPFLQTDFGIIDLLQTLWANNKYLAGHLGKLKISYN